MGSSSASHDAQKKVGQTCAAFDVLKVVGLIVLLLRLRIRQAKGMLLVMCMRRQAKGMLLVMRDRGLVCLLLNPPG